MPCQAVPRGFTDTKYPWYDPTDNNPCGKPTLTSVGGVDVSAQNLCALHYKMRYGQAAVPSPAVADPLTVLLLHGETLADEKGHPVTAFGDAKVDTAQSKFGGSSYLFDGAGDYLSIPDSPDWDFGAGDFTIDLWARFNTGTNVHTFLSQNAAVAGDWAWTFQWLGSTTQLRFDLTVDGVTQQARGWTWAPTLGQWYHVAVVRRGDTDLAFYVDGVRIGLNTTLTGAIWNSSAALLIGGRASGVNWMNGNLDEIRISKGIARWWGTSFTPPTAPYA